MTRYNAKTEQGLTLVEVLIALSVLAVALLPVMIGFINALSTTSQSAMVAGASSIAREKIEQLKDLGYDQIQSQPVGGNTPERKDWGTPGDGFFEVRVAVQELEPNDATNKGLKSVRVSVYRTGSPNPVVTLTNYFTPYGV